MEWNHQLSVENPKIHQNSVFQTPMTFERLISKAEYLHKLLVGFTKGIRLGCWNVWNIRYESPRFVMFALITWSTRCTICFFEYRYVFFMCIVKAWLRFTLSESALLAPDDSSDLKLGKVSLVSCFAWGKVTIEQWSRPRISKEFHRIS